ncbi:hypothetical protein E4T48_04306 [Aureobasidium sp. EXF-10727]|nr:hypothetical protein E4T48_04306 [Aureobasidium sp. EXF-10727]
MSQTPSGKPSTHFGYGFGGFGSASLPPPPNNNTSAGPDLYQPALLAPPMHQSLLTTSLHQPNPRPLFRSPEQSLHLTRDLPVLSLSVSSHHIYRKSYKETVILVVGAAKEHYSLHKELLCFYSDFLRAAFNGSFKEATERKIELPDVEIEVFESFQVWLYTQKMPKNEIRPAQVYPEWPLLTKLWIFGDKYQIPLLQNNVADAMLDKVDKDKEAPLFALNLAYENTTSNAPLRKILVDVMAYRGDMSAKGPHLDSKYWSLQACLDAMGTMDSARTQKIPRHTMPVREKCYYHVHAAGEKC